VVHIAVLVCAAVVVEGFVMIVMLISG